MAETYGLYALYEDIKTIEGITATADDDMLRGFCEQASRMMDASCFRVFYPRSETRYFDHPWDTSILPLDDDLLEVTTFTTENGDTTVASSDYFLLCGSQYNLMPYDRIHMKSDGNRPNLLYSGTTQRSNAITGIWGYHESWGSPPSPAWQDSQDTLQSGIDAATATLSVSGVDGMDLHGTTPRFKVGQLLRIDDEYVYVEAKDTALDTLTVRRGVNGTTAAAHDSTTTIYVYMPMMDIVRTTRRLAAWLYHQKDAPYQEKVAIPELGEVVIPAAVPVDIRLVMKRYRRN